MKIILNGEARDVADSATLADAAMLMGVAITDRGVAAAVDGAVVPRSGWAGTRLDEGARVEIVRAAAGG